MFTCRYRRQEHRTRNGKNNKNYEGELGQSSLLAIPPAEAICWVCSGAMQWPGHPGV